MNIKINWHESRVLFVKSIKWFLIVSVTHPHQLHPLAKISEDYFKLQSSKACIKILNPIWGKELGVNSLFADSNSNFIHWLPPYTSLKLWVVRDLWECLCLAIGRIWICNFFKSFNYFIKTLYLPNCLSIEKKLKEQSISRTLPKVLIYKFLSQYGNTFISLPNSDVNEPITVFQPSIRPYIKIPRQLHPYIAVIRVNNWIALYFTRSDGWGDWVLTTIVLWSYPWDVCKWF